jgi:hypothetical protein
VRTLRCATTHVLNASACNRLCCTHICAVTTVRLKSPSNQLCSFTPQLSTRPVISWRQRPASAGSGPASSRVRRRHRPRPARPGPANLGCLSSFLLSRIAAHRTPVPCRYHRPAPRDGFCAGQRPGPVIVPAGRRPRTTAAGRGRPRCSGLSVSRAWQDRTRPSSPRTAERGERNGNVPRRSPHPLKVFPRVQ